MSGNSKLDHLSAVFLNNASLLQFEQSSNDYLRKMQRRACIFSASCSDEVLLQMRSTEQEYFREVVCLVEAYRQHLTQLSAMADLALNRLRAMDLPDETMDLKPEMKGDVS